MMFVLQMLLQKLDVGFAVSANFIFYLNFQNVSLGKYPM